MLTPMYDGNPIYMCGRFADGVGKWGDWSSPHHGRRYHRKRTLRRLRPFTFPGDDGSVPAIACARLSGRQLKRCLLVHNHRSESSHAGLAGRFAMEELRR